jgi:hypothetical protein
MLVIESGAGKPGLLANPGRLANAAIICEPVFFFDFAIYLSQLPIQD